MVSAAMSSNPRNDRIGRLRRVDSLFFFEKKNQKTFVCWRLPVQGKRDESLFASFSSEKEDFLPFDLLLDA
jgi:hypothetical protein